MDTIYTLGDRDTVAAFQLAGVPGQVVDSGTVAQTLARLLRQGDVGIVLVTRELAAALPQSLSRMNMERFVPALIEIPAVDDARGFGPSVLGALTHALGVAV